MKRVRKTISALLAWMRRAIARALQRRRNRLQHRGGGAGTAGTAGRTGRTETAESAGSAGTAERTGRTGRTGTTERTGNSGRTESCYRADAIRFNEQFLRERYELRYNILKKTTEFRPKPSANKTIYSPPLGGGAGGEVVGGEVVGGGAFLPLTDRDLNLMTTEQLKAGGQSWSYGMKLCIDSASVPTYNPVTDYLDSCPPWDGHDHIGDLARRVPTDYEQWQPFFHRWMLAMVAQATGRCTDHGNAVVPMLIGQQGTRKTTFCKMILPRELRDYFMDDVKMDNAEQVERVLGRMWLVCIDEYNSKTVREQAKIKRLLTEKDVQVRRMCSDQYTLTPRMASFIATTNEQQPLCDPTGSRRYLCVEVSGIIDTDSPLDHRQLYAQALHELDNGHPWHFTKDEEEAIMAHNSHYQLRTAADELLTACFRPAEVCKETLVPATDILRVLQQQLKGTTLTMHQLIEALRSQHFHYGAQQGRHGWYATRAEVESQ